MILEELLNTLVHGQEINIIGHRISETAIVDSEEFYNLQAKLGSTYYVDSIEAEGDIIYIRVSI